MSDKSSISTLSRRDVFVSVVCMLRNTEETLPEKLDALSNVLREHFQYYEIILIDNASTDETAALAPSLLETHKNIQYCALSVRVNESTAFAAGVERTIGDFIVTMDLKLDPPAIIPELVAKAVAGTEIVYGLSDDRVEGTRFYDHMARLFLRSVARFNNVNVPETMSTFRVFSRSVLNYMLESRDFHRTLALAPALSGYSYASVNYQRLERPDAKNRRVGLQALIKALDLVFSTSVRPLRLISLLSVGMSIASIVYAIYIVLTRILADNVAPGWATLSLQVSVLFFFISLVLAVMCEYLLQILETTNRRPVFHIARERYSSTMDYERELNVRDTRSLNEPAQDVTRS